MKCWTSFGGNVQIRNYRRYLEWENPAPDQDKIHPILTPFVGISYN